VTVCVGSPLPASPGWPVAGCCSGVCVEGVGAGACTIAEGCVSTTCSAGAATCVPAAAGCVGGGVGVGVGTAGRGRAAVTAGVEGVAGRTAGVTLRTETTVRAAGLVTLGDREMVRTPTRRACFTEGEAGSDGVTSDAGTFTTVTGAGAAAAGGGPATGRGCWRTSRRGSASALAAATQSSSPATIRPVPNLKVTPSLTTILSIYRRKQSHPLGGARRC
jgi:hypothetical protein